MKTSLYTWEKFPEDMTNYLRNYGMHFSKKMYEFAVKKMYKINKQNGLREKPPVYTKEQVENTLKRYNITLESNVLYDAAYVMSMAVADFFHSSLVNEQQLAQFVKDYIDDVDQPDGFVFNRFYGDCILSGEPIDWSDML